MYIRPFLFILTCTFLGCGQQATNDTKQSALPKNAIDRLDDRYTVTRTLFDFPKRGISIPAEVYLLSAATTRDSPALPEVSTAAYGTHYVTADELRVPPGAQCNMAIGSLQLFLNAGSVLVMGNEGPGGDAFQLSGEAFVKTGPDKGCVITASGAQISVRRNSTINISAYEEDDSWTLVAGRGSAAINTTQGERMELAAGQVLVRRQGRWQADRTGIRPADASGWISGRLVSRNRPLAAICCQLGRLYGTHILLTKDIPPDVYNIPYREMTLREVLESLEQALQLHAVFRADSVWLQPAAGKGLTR